MIKSKSHIVILGAGPCGLYAARTLVEHNFRVTLIDKGERPGGLATSFRYGENWYDMGVHMLHAFDQEIFNDVKQLMADERIEVKLNAKIKWAEGFFRYPLQFQDMIKGIPFFHLCYQVFNLFAAQLKNYFFPWQPCNAEEALIQLYGKPLYKFFFEDFTHRYWEIHPRDLSATFITTKMPKLTAVDVVKKALEKIGVKQRAKTTESALTKETLHYSKTGAEAMPRNIAKKITELGGNILNNATVENVFVENNQIKKVIFNCQGQLHEIACDACIATIPLRDLIASIRPNVPESVRTAADNLHYKPIVVYGLLVKKPKCIDALYIYYRNRIFHRIGEPKNGGLLVHPDTHTVLIVEMTCKINDAKWRGDESIKTQLMKELAEENICQANDIVELHITRSETGYPIFNLGFEQHLEEVKDYIKQIANLQSTGRQGAFTYPNMHTAMRMGKKAADEVIKSFS